MFILNDVPAAVKDTMEIKNIKLKKFLFLIIKYPAAIISNTAIDCWNIIIISLMEIGRKTDMNEKIRITEYILNNISFFLFLYVLPIMANKRDIIKGNIDQ